MSFRRSPRFGTTGSCLKLARLGTFLAPHQVGQLSRVQETRHPSRSSVLTQPRPIAVPGCAAQLRRSISQRALRKSAVEAHEISGLVVREVEATLNCDGQSKPSHAASGWPRVWSARYSWLSRRLSGFNRGQLPEAASITCGVWTSFTESQTQHLLQQRRPDPCQGYGATRLAP